MFEILYKRGIRNTNLCTLCNEEEESIDHLFLHCPFARAVWHGSNLEVRTSELVHSSVDYWLSASIMHNINRRQDRMFFLQSLCTILWMIWNHRHKVLHQGKLSNPMEVILTAQSLVCRYQEAFQNKQSQHPSPNHSPRMSIKPGWQVIIKGAAWRNRKTKRSGWAYEVKATDGSVLVKAGERNGSKSAYQSTQEALMEAIFKTKELGFSKMLILCNSKMLTQACSKRRRPAWHEQTFISDLNQLNHQGVSVSFLFVPKEIIADVLYMAHITTVLPVQFCRLRPDLTF